MPSRRVCRKIRRSRRNAQLREEICPLPRLYRVHAVRDPLPSRQFGQGGVQIRVNPDAMAALLDQLGRLIVANQPVHPGAGALAVALAFVQIRVERPPDRLPDRHHPRRPQCGHVRSRFERRSKSVYRGFATHYSFWPSSPRHDRGLAHPKLVQEPARSFVPIQIKPRGGQKDRPKLPPRGRLPIQAGEPESKTLTSCGQDADHGVSRAVLDCGTVSAPPPSNGASCPSQGPRRSC